MSEKSLLTNKSKKNTANYQLHPIQQRQNKGDNNQYQRNQKNYMTEITLLENGLPYWLI